MNALPRAFTRFILCSTSDLLEVNSRSVVPETKWISSDVCVCVCVIPLRFDFTRHFLNMVGPEIAFQGIRTRDAC
jgi:hypothetical protein